jgi:hypothetical protein
VIRKDLRQRRIRRLPDLTDQASLGFHTANLRTWSNGTV